MLGDKCAKILERLAFCKMLDNKQKIEQLFCVSSRIFLDRGGFPGQIAAGLTTRCP